MLDNLNTIIFDLGEVIVDVDASKTTLAFSSLFNIDSSELYTFHQQKELFTLLEKGLISESVFRDDLRKTMNAAHVSDEQIDIAWNAMLGETPQKKLLILQTLKEKYKILALSNTNSIHIRYVNDSIKNRNGIHDSLENYFHHAYYSHDLQERKPDKAIYNKIIDLENLEVAKCLFIDDRIENIKTAQELGMQTFHMTHPEQFYELF